MKKTIIFLLFFAVFGYGSFWVSMKTNYPVHRQIRMNLVEHPEFIPSAGVIKTASSGYERLVADFYWLDTIQYIGSNAMSAEYKKYLAAMLGLVTDISPKFTYPYQIGLLMLPGTNARYETLSPEEEKKHTDEAIALGIKGIRNTCDLEKIEAIKKEFNLQKLFSDPIYANPCEDPMIPYYLAFDANWNANDPLAASEWYRVAGTNADAPKGARIMSAIMQGKSGDREKAIIMFLSLAETLDPNPEGLCRTLSAELRSVLIPAFSSGKKLNQAFLKEVEKARKAAQEALGEKEDDLEKTDISAYCSSYLNKSVREMNLKFIQDADALYFQATGEHALHAKELFKKGYIDYLPVDYQKWLDGYSIIYVYNKKTDRWDFQMGKYDELSRDK